MFVTRFLWSLGRSLLSARWICPHNKLVTGLVTLFNLYLFPCLIFSTCYTSLTWVSRKFINLDFRLDLVYFYFFLNFPNMRTFTLGTVCIFVHLPLSNRVQVHWFTPKSANMPRTFQKITCFLFKSKIYVFSYCFTLVWTSYECLSIWLNVILVFSCDWSGFEN